MGILRTTGFLMLGSTLSCWSDNHFITAHPTSDPAPSVFTYNGVEKVYFYCTQDMLPGASKYPIDTIHVYSSDDMYHWKDEGAALTEKEVPWANQGSHQLWAPHVVYLKGLYRLYAPEQASDKNAYNFVATSTSPTGPFKAGPAMTALGGGAIDPFCFIDKDSSVWLSYRNGGARLALRRMNDSGTTVTASSNDVVNTGAPAGYVEGSWMWERNGMYYLVYAFEPGSTGNEEIAYSTATSAQGPWTYRGVILAKNSGEWTSHVGICQFKGQWYVFWHDVNFGGQIFGKKRCTNIEYLSYNADGTILPIVKTLRGVGIPSAFADTIQVDRYSSITGATTSGIAYNSGSSELNGWIVSGISNGSSVRYDKVDFTPGPGEVLTMVSARVSSTNANGTIQVRLGSATGTLLGTIKVPGTGGLNNWTTTAPFQLAASPPPGVQNLVLVFSTSASGSFQVNWVKFGKTTTSVRSGATSRSSLRMEGRSLVATSALAGTGIVEFLSPMGENLKTVSVHWASGETRIIEPPEGKTGLIFARVVFPGAEMHVQRWVAPSVAFSPERR